MKPSIPWPPLMVVSNRQMTTDLSATVAGALDGGAKWILLREKDMAPPARLDLAWQLKAATDSHAALLGVNSDIAAARSVGAGNVQLPMDQLHRNLDGSRFLLGASVHDVEEAVEAVNAGVDYLLLAPIFATESKTLHRRPLGLAGLRAIAEVVRIPIIALGGILPERATDCLAAGATGVAAMGAVMRPADPAAVVHAFLKAMSR
jgi:thiamine-phosphate pyrophosphorylase